MQDIAGIFDRRTAADVVFDTLHDEIVNLQLLPGTKLSEAEVSRRFGVSRQPVRDAFNRLGNMDLLLIRPQKATVVRGFSLPRIQHARFVRLAVELEVIRQACAVWTDDSTRALTEILDRQDHAISQGDTEAFHASDYSFHKAICDLADRPLAAETISECKQKVDRLCMLSLGRAQEAATLLEDHRRIADALARRDADAATEAARIHLGRLDDVIDEIHRTRAEFFE